MDFRPVKQWASKKKAKTVFIVHEKTLKPTILVANKVHPSAAGAMKDLICHPAFTKATTCRGRAMAPHADL